jgi:amidase
VAAGLAPVAHGSDGAGSIRTPASACGLVGYKPSRGTVSAYPQVAFASFGIEGPLARTLEDAALLADVMAVPPPGEIWPDPRPAGTGRLRDAARRGEVRPLRVAWWTGTGVAGVEPHPAVVDAVRAVAARLDAAGHAVDEIDPPATYDERIVRSIVLKFGGGIGAALAVVPPERHELLRPISKYFLGLAAAASAVDGAIADATLAAFTSAVLSRVAGYDLLVCPTASGPPVPVGWFSEAGPAEEPRSTGDGARPRP